MFKLSIPDIFNSLTLPLRSEPFVVIAVLKPYLFFSFLTSLKNLKISRLTSGSPPVNLIFLNYNSPANISITLNNSSNDSKSILESLSFNLFGLQ